MSFDPLASSTRPDVYDINQSSLYMWD